jgi:hypothetical protein
MTTTERALARFPIALIHRRQHTSFRFIRAQRRNRRTSPRLRGEVDRERLFAAKAVG